MLFLKTNYDIHFWHNIQQYFLRQHSAKERSCVLDIDF